MTAGRLEPQTGTAFEMAAGELLKVIDLEGEQVADFVAFNRADPSEWLSSGRSIDYANTIYLTTGHILYSNRSRPMLTIVQDDVGRHDFLLTPCSEATFRHFYKDKPVHRGCFGNLAEALAPYGVEPDALPVAFNIFMHVPVDADGGLKVLPPETQPGASIEFRALADLVVGLTACSAYDSCGGTFKPIDYSISPGE